MTNPVSARPASHTLPGDWAADLAACTVTFAVRNFGLRTVVGQIPLTSATVTVGPGGQPAAIRAELDARAIDTSNLRRDSHLRGPRFFATDRWPAITFEAGNIQANHASWTVHGTLTVKDTHCPVQLDVTRRNKPPGDPAAPIDLRATGHLDRRSAGVTRGPAFLIGHMISLSLAVRLRPPAAVSTPLSRTRDSAALPKHPRRKPAEGARPPLTAAAILAPRRWPLRRAGRRAARDPGLLTITTTFGLQTRRP
jgi:polyisoprenoid-binding protein YceI